MLENSYDIPGIHFGIIISKRFHDLHRKDSSLRIETLESALKNNECDIISLDQISGLQAKEIISIVNDVEDINCNCIVFTVYYHLKYPNICTEATCEKKGTRLGNISVNLDIDICTETRYNGLIYTNIYNIEESAKDRELDDIVVDTINSDYSTTSEDNRRWMRCFLQRHKYGTKDRVDEELPKVFQKQ